MEKLKEARYQLSLSIYNSKLILNKKNPLNFEEEILNDDYDL